MQILNQQPCLYMRAKNGKTVLNFFYTKCAVNSGKLRKNCLLWIHKFVKIAQKLRCATSQFSGGTI